MKGDESIPDPNIQLSKKQQTKSDIVKEPRPSVPASKSASKSSKAKKSSWSEVWIKFSRLPKKAKTQIIIGLSAVLAVVIVAAVIIFGICLPLALDNDKNQYLSENNLMKAVEVSDLALIDYVYKGVAEHVSQGWLGETVDYRVQYEAHVGASCDFSTIKFLVDPTTNTVTAYLPEIVIEAPVLDDSTFDYLPENTPADLSEVIALCKADAENEIDREQMSIEAYESLKNTVTALTMPLLNQSGFEIKFANFPIEG